MSMVRRCAAPRPRSSPARGLARLKARPALAAPSARVLPCPWPVAPIRGGQPTGFCQEFAKCGPIARNTLRLRPRRYQSRYWLCWLLSSGERAGNRTPNPLIKSQMLYLLSYALARSRRGGLVPTTSCAQGQLQTGRAWKEPDDHRCANPAEFRWEAARRVSAPAMRRHRCRKSTRSSPSGNTSAHSGLSLIQSRIVERSMTPPSGLTMRNT